MADEPDRNHFVSKSQPRAGVPVFLPPPAREQALRASKACSLLDAHPRAMALETWAFGRTGGECIRMQPWLRGLEGHLFWEALPECPGFAGGGQCSLGSPGHRVPHPIGQGFSPVCLSCVPPMASWEPRIYCWLFICVCFERKAGLPGPLGLQERGSSLVRLRCGKDRERRVLGARRIGAWVQVRPRRSLHPFRPP